MAASASLFTSQPIDPPRAVKYPTSRRSDLNSGVAGAGAEAGRAPDLLSADDEDFSAAIERVSRPAVVNIEERRRKSRRFMVGPVKLLIPANKRKFAGSLDAQPDDRRPPTVETVGGRSD